MRLPLSERYKTTRMTPSRVDERKSIANHWGIDHCHNRSCSLAANDDLLLLLELTDEAFGHVQSSSRNLGWV